MRASIRFAVVVAAAAVLAASGCTAQSADRRSSSAASVAATAAPAADDLVTVPDAFAVLKRHKSTYEGDDFQAALAETEAYLSGYLEGAGLSPDVEFQPYTIPDSQEPTAGVRVPRGTVVHVRIGVAD